MGGGGGGWWYHLIPLRKCKIICIDFCGVTNYLYKISLGVTHYPDLNEVITLLLMKT